jgi:cytosine/uracil/thiamine/allantoin permease
VEIIHFALTPHINLAHISGNNAERILSPRFAFEGLHPPLVYFALSGLFSARLAMCVRTRVGAFHRDYPCSTGGDNGC